MMIIFVQNNMVYITFYTADGIFRISETLSKNVCAEIQLKHSVLLNDGGLIDILDCKRGENSTTDGVFACRKQFTKKT